MTDTALAVRRPRIEVRPRIVTDDDPDVVAIGELMQGARRFYVEGVMASVRNLIEAGRRLKAKKAELPHGRWLPWVKDNAEALNLGDAPERLSQRLMLAADKYDVRNVVFDETEAVRISREVWGNKNQPRGTLGTGDNEWHTPLEYFVPARNALGGIGCIDLDPASSAAAQRTINAKRYFTKATDGLSKEWHGRIWLNPPYERGLIDRFVAKLLAERAAGRVTAAIMLTHNYTDNEWFQGAAAVADALCFTNGRIRFINAQGELATPTQGQCFFFFGPDVERFKSEFASIGFIVVPVHKQTDRPRIRKRARA